ncbi:MAG: phosphoribosylglycinamide formyltransferase [Clostridia bacterium]|nr:phosphoribosylglycinamide formyltransferase [Clostridia bacterium]
MKKIAILASGSGTNAECIARYFASHPSISVDMILSNSADAYVLKRAEVLNIPTKVFTREELADANGIAALLQSRGISLVVLAGFLWLVPVALLKAFPNKIINIHPALLPGYGGKNMYGSRVHQAVIDAAEAESGITIHRVDEQYDCGEILFQARCPVLPDDTAETLAQRIHTLEYQHFPVVIEQLLSQPEVGFRWDGNISNS